jgi:hypothetical protein
MARKEDLEQLIHDGYDIICENQRIIQESPDLPAQRKRARRQVDQQWDNIRGYLAEYVPLCLTLHATVPDDIIQIVVRFPEFITQLTRLANGEKVLDTAANELLEQVKQAEKSRLTFEVAEQRDYGREIADLRRLIEMYHSYTVRFKRRPGGRLGQHISISGA